MILAAIILFEVILLEFILGLSNVWFATFLGEKLPQYNREKARTLGLCFAWLGRILALVFYSFVADSHFTIKSIPGINFYWVDIILLAGGTWIMFKSTELLFFNRSANRSSIDLKIVLLQSVFISAVLSVDAVRTASFYVNNKLIASVIILLTMVASSWLSGRIIELLHIQTKGLVLLLFSTGLLLVLEAFHQPILSELICFGAALYLMNAFLLPKFGNPSEKIKPTADEHN
ncbi:hypothetical protein [Chryseolinea sp. H1M3-3]|uniref:TerC family protein n=1 Tax=Chryseolinea sp. H1M3-3 TaxID=3034144 RepID=UPI0023EDAFC2|nr:hypothetical protein [Chryseolinea sp. H1M3-3]